MPQVLPCPPATSNAPPPTQVLLFPNLSSTLTEEQKTQIAAFADNWNSLGKGTTVRVDGFASKPGEDALNWKLSCDRAIAVRTELVSPSGGAGPGIPDGSINLFMHGETDDFGDEAQNRRVTLFQPSSAPSDTRATPNQPDNPPKPDPSGGGAAEPKPRPACAQNPKCDPLYCAPFATRAEALQDRDANAGTVMSRIRTANGRAAPLFQKFIFDPGPAGDISKEFAVDFTKSDSTIDATRILVKTLEDLLKANPPAFPPGSNTVTVDINAALGANSIHGFKTLNEFLETALLFADPLTVPGLIAGGVGPKSEKDCKVGANTDGAQNDARSATGTVTVTKNPDGTLLITPNITYTVVDTLDFCPGNCGGAIAQLLTIPLSRWEASSISGDVPFTVHFPAPSLTGASGSEE